jgi:hypothetical protein
MDHTLVTDLALMVAAPLKMLKLKELGLTE